MYKVFDSGVVYYYDDRSMNYFVKNKYNKFILVRSSEMKNKLKNIRASIFDVHDYESDNSDYVVEKNFVKSQRDKIKNNEPLDEDDDDDEYIIINDVKENKPMIKGWFTTSNIKKVTGISLASSLIGTLLYKSFKK